MSSITAIHSINLNWHERGYFYLVVLFGLDFVCWIFTKSLQTFLEVKIDTLPSSLIIFQNHLCGAKDEHFSCFHSSCQLGLKDLRVRVVFLSFLFPKHLKRNAKIKAVKLCFMYVTITCKILYDMYAKWVLF